MSTVQWPAAKCILIQKRSVWIFWENGHSELQPKSGAFRCIYRYIHICRYIDLTQFFTCFGWGYIIHISNPNLGKVDKIWFSGIFLAYCLLGCLILVVVCCDGGPWWWWWWLCSCDGGPWWWWWWLCSTSINPDLNPGRRRPALGHSDLPPLCPQIAPILVHKSPELFPTSSHQPRPCHTKSRSIFTHIDHFEERGECWEIQISVFICSSDRNFRNHPLQR